MSKQLVGGLAKQGEGKAEFVKSGENLDAIVMRQLNRALKPSLVNVPFSPPFVSDFCKVES